MDYGLPSNASLTPTMMTKQTVGVQLAVDNQRETVQAALDGQQERLSNLHETITMLEERLRAVLAPLPPAPSGNGGGAPMPISVMARTHIHNDIISVAVDRLHHLIQRLEI